MDTKAMYRLGYGLYLLSAQQDGRDNGCIVNSVLQLTSSPLTVGVAVNKANLTHEYIMANRAFNLSVLTEKTPFSFFRQFGFQSGRTADKFAGFSGVKRSGNGLYYYEDANAILSAWTTDTVDLGTHTLFLATVADAQVLSNEPSTTYQYYQTNIKPQPATDAKKGGWRCRVCGYVYESDVLPEDFICPICKHGASDFERI